MSDNAEIGRRYGSGKYTGKSAYTLLVNYRTPYGNGMMSEFVPINNCSRNGGQAMADTEKQEDYTGLVLVEFKEGGKRYLFEAPPWGRKIKPGSFVMTGPGVVAKVVACIEAVDTSINRRFVEFAIAAAGARLPLARVRAVMNDIPDSAGWCTWRDWEPGK